METGGPNRSGMRQSVLRLVIRSPICPSLSNAREFRAPGHSFHLQSGARPLTMIHRLIEKDLEPTPLSSVYLRAISTWDLQMQKSLTTRLGLWLGVGAITGGLA